jgi:hypothetical protein
MLVVPIHPMFPLETDPTIIESQDRANKFTRTLCERGLDAFEFKSEDGRHYVVTRDAQALRCFEFDQFVAFTSSRMVEALGKPWSPPGRA